MLAITSLKSFSRTQVLGLFLQVVFTAKCIHWEAPTESAYSGCIEYSVRVAHLPAIEVIATMLFGMALAMLLTAWAFARVRSHGLQFAMWLFGLFTILVSPLFLRLVQDIWL